MAINYEFPRIECLNDVLPHVDDCFRVIEKDSGHTFINYNMMGNDTFPPMDGSNDLRSAMRRECRGIAFYTDTGKIASRPFHKFFNAGEREDVSFSHVDLSHPHNVMDKVDGSMIRPLMVGDDIRWGTKMGITDVALLSEEWAMDHPQYEELARLMISLDCTPLFEFVSRRNRIVVDYAEESMILLAVRDNVLGTYLSRDALVGLSERNNVPLVEVYSSLDGSSGTENFVNSIRGSDDFDEGVVVQWDNGHCVKVKTEAYSIMHRAKEATRTERTFVTAIMNDVVDDTIPLLPTDQQAAALRYIDRFWYFVKMISDDLDALYNGVIEDYEDKKEFALSDFGKELEALERANVFALWNGKVENSREAVLNMINSALSSETKWSDFRCALAVCSNLSRLEVNWNGMEEE